MADVTLAIKLADGTTYRNTGFINIQSFSNQDAKLTVDLMPRNNAWSLFSGSGDTSGSIKAVAIAGVTYQVAADADITFQPSGYKNEVVLTGSGPVMRKMTVQETSITGLVITASSKDVDALRQIAEG